MSGCDNKRASKWCLSLLILLGLTVLLVAVKYFTRRVSEPAYDGKSLGEWLAIYSASESLTTDLAKAEAAEAAVRKIGTNGLPAMLRWIRYKPSSWKYSANCVLIRMPVVVRRAFRDRDLENAYNAKEGFKILGPTAAPAASELARIIADPRSGQAGALAVEALGAMGTNGLPFLLQEIDARGLNSEGAIGELVEMQEAGIDVERAAPVLLQYVPSNGYVAEDAGEILLRLAKRSPALVPLLIRSLDSSNEMAQLGAIEVLGGIGSRAESSSPTLVKLLNSPEYKVRSAAANALQRIASQRE